MRKIILFIVFLLSGFSLGFSQNSSTILKKDSVAHIYLSGTCKSSGEHSVIYGWKDYLRGTSDPYTFKCEILASDSWGDLKRVKILNVTDKTARVKVTCIKGYNYSKTAQVIDIKPRTYSLYFSEPINEYEKLNYECEELKIELVKLFNE